MLAATRFHRSPRYQAYLDFLSRFLPVNPDTATGFNLADLNVAQKWLLMYTLDIFGDHMIMFPQNPDGWLEAWTRNTEAMVPGFHAIVADPSLVDDAKVNTVWEELRAARA